MNHTLIVAEIGVNMGGDFDIAKRLIDMAVDSEADAVKMQCWRKNRFPDIENLRLPFEQIAYLKKYTEWQGVKWFSSAFDNESIDFLDSLGMDIWKIPSGMLTNERYLRKITEVVKDKRIIMATGMADVEEIEKAVDIVGKDNLILLHCVTAYPTPYEEVNLRAMDALRCEFCVPVGISDHTLGIEVPIAAVAWGAIVVEKHFTLNKKMVGPDHAASLEPREFKEMVAAIRNIEKALGSHIKKPTPSELKIRDEIRERMAYC
jgi:N,N'-diacetyllegionaminate synthase